MAVTILPGIDESIGPRIKALGEAIYQRTGLARRRMIEEAVLKNPRVAQEFADLEFKAPGTLEKLGLKDVGEMLAKIRPSRELEIDTATRGEAIPTAVATAKGQRNIAEFQNEAIQEFKDAITPEQRASAAQKILQAPSLSDIKEEKLKVSDIKGPEAEMLVNAIITGDFADLPTPLLQLYKQNKDLIDVSVKSIVDQIQTTKQNRIEETDNLLGYAIQIADEIARTQTQPNLEEVTSQLVQKFPQYAADPQKAGLLQNVANEAISTVMARGPKTQEERRLSTFYVKAAPAFEVIRNLQKKGLRWNTKMDLANSLMRASAGADFSFGVGAGAIDRKGTSDYETKNGRQVLTQSGRRSLTQKLDEAIETITKGTGKSVGTGTGRSIGTTALLSQLKNLRANLVAGGDMTSEDIPSVLMGELARASMSDDEYRFFTNSVRLVEGLLRKDTGFRIEKNEFRDRLNQNVGREGEGEASLKDKDAATALEIEQLRELAKLRPDHIKTMREKVLRNQGIDISGDFPDVLTPTTNADPPITDSVDDPNRIAADSVDQLLKEANGDSTVAFGALMQQVGNQMGLGKVKNFIFTRTMTVLGNLMKVDETIAKVRNNREIANRQAYVDSLEARKKKIVSETRNGKLRSVPVEAEVQMMLQAMYPLQSDSARYHLLRSLRRAGATDVVINEVMKELKLDPKLLEEY